VADVAGAGTVPCETAVANEPPGETLLAGSVFIATNGLVPEPSGRVSPRLFAKAGLWVRSERAARLTVIAPAAALIGWGPSAEPARQVLVPRCSRHEPWLVWPGGFWVASPMCVTVRLEVEDDAVDVRVPVGARCD
jgi:hypothetical protein